MGAALTAEFDKRIQFGPAQYTYYLRIHDDTAKLRELLAGLAADRFVLVTDKGVPPRHVARLRDLLAELAPCKVLTTPTGEHAKNLSTIEAMAGAALTWGAARGSVFVAFGGGQPGNVAGVLAHLYLRGSRLVHIPTTLLAMSDSVLSLKQAVNSAAGKNHLGGYHAPEFVWTDLTYAKSLPAVEIRSALCEMIKNVLAIMPGRYDWAMSRLRQDARYDVWDLADFCAFCIDAKQQVMRADHREVGPGLVLEYGHTIGHAAELLTPGGLSHGLAVAVGMLAAARVAAELGYLSRSDERAHRVLLDRAGVPGRLPYRIPARDVLAALDHDNKRGYYPPKAGIVDMVLLDGLGRPHLGGDRPLTRVPVHAVERAIPLVMPPLPARPLVPASA